MKTQSQYPNIARPYYLHPLGNQMGSKLGRNEKSLRKVAPLIAKRTSATQEFAHAIRALHLLYRFDPPFPILITSAAIVVALEESLFFRERHILINHKNMMSHAPSWATPAFILVNDGLTTGAIRVISFEKYVKQKDWSRPTDYVLCP